MHRKFHTQDEHNTFILEASSFQDSALSLSLISQLICLKPGYVNNVTEFLVIVLRGSSRDDFLLLFFYANRKRLIFFLNSSSHTSADSSNKILFKSILFSKNDGQQVKKSSFGKNAFEGLRVRTARLNTLDFNCCNFPTTSNFGKLLC